MASILQGIITKCLGCKKIETTNVDVYEALTFEEARPFVERNFVKPCENCGDVCFKLCGLIKYSDKIKPPKIEERRTSMAP